MIAGPVLWPDPANVTQEQLRTLARQRLALDAVRSAETSQGDHLLNPDFIDWVMDRATRPAAVLIPLIERKNGFDVLLTKRMDHLKSHSGQVAFPGGKIDDTDASPQAAALREAQEEIGLEPAFTEVLGSLPEYYTGSGYRITPVIALVDPAAVIEANPQEVDYVFEAPLSFLMDTTNHRRGSKEFSGKTRYFLEIPYREHYIWGVTAGIIALMRDRLFA